MITNPNIQILEAAAERLRTLTEEMVFVGGCATGLLLTDPAASPVRATIDVDVLVEVATLVEYHWLSEVQKAGEELKDYLVVRCSMLLKERNFLDALPGHLLPDAASQARSALIIDRLKTISGFRSFKGGIISP